MLKRIFLWVARSVRQITTGWFLKLPLLLFFAGALLVLGLRHYVLPEIERYHDEITTAAAMAVGQPLLIGHIGADWKGLRPRLLFTDVKVLDRQGRVALSLPRVESTVALTSLPALELRFHSLLIDSPDLSVRRDQQGHWFVAGIPLEVSDPDSGIESADWLLHQSSVIIRHGHISWQDEMRGAPTLELREVDLKIENRYRRHRFALRASPPDRLASRLDVRGNFRGNSFTDLADWQGQLYVQLEYADVSAWRPWVELPHLIQRGQGAMRLWLGFGAGQLRSVEGDVALASVRARLGEDLPQLDLGELRGRIGWRMTGGGLEVFSQRLALQMRDGFSLKPTDFYLRLVQSADGANASGVIRANVLDLDDLVHLAGYLPLSEAIRQQLFDAAPRGHINGLDLQWRNRADRTLHFDVKARFQGLALRRVGERPGFAGLSGEIDGDDLGGAIRLASPGLTLDIPQLFPEPVTFNTFKARLGWKRNTRGLEFRLGDVEIANPDLAGTVRGSYQLEQEGPGFVDATIEMKRAAVQATARYTPIPVVNQAARDWLQTALRGGQADRFYVRLQGDLRDFPFVNGTGGVFRLEARAHDVRMAFAEGWPMLEDADVSLLIDSSRLSIDATHATTAGVQIINAKVGIDDLLADEPVLWVHGEAADVTQRCLDYIVKSPVNGYLNGLTEGMLAKGEGKLNLRLDIPLAGEAPVRVRGEYRFLDNEIDLGERVPLLRNVTGVLRFTESSLGARGIQAQVLGGPAQIAIASEQGTLVARAQGRLDLDHLNHIQPHPLWQRVHGSAEWTATVRLRDSLADVAVDADFRDIASTLPAPFSKLAGDPLPVHFTQKDIHRHQDRLELRYGDLVAARLIRQVGETGRWEFRRGYIALGGARGEPDREGLWIVGRLPQFDLAGWTGIGLGDGRWVLPDIAGVDVQVTQLNGFGNTLSELNIKGSGRNGLLSLRLVSPEVNGDLIWQPQGNGKLLGRFRNLMLRVGKTAEQPPLVVQGETIDNSGFPEVDVMVDRLGYQGRQLGRLVMGMHAAGKDVVLDRLVLTNPDGVLEMSGRWQAVPEQTQLALRVDIVEAGNILSRSGYPGSLKGARGALTGSLYWNGGPGAYSIARLNGTLDLKVGKGRFLKVEPGAAKLLGVLSLQRLSLGFTDVFDRGFEFESITGHAEIVNGLLLTNDMKLTGPVAKVLLSGQVDLNRETQELKVRILPGIGDNLSLLSFAAGPAVGVGVLLADKILGSPLDRLASIDYNVTGSWMDPKVEKVGQTSVSRRRTEAAE